MISRCMSAILFILLMTTHAFAVEQVVTVLRSADPAHVEATLHVSKVALKMHPNKVTILFDDKAINLLDVRKEPLVLKSGETLHQEIQNFIESGGHVSACAKCIQHIPDLLPKNMVKGTTLSNGKEMSKLDKTKKVSVDFYYK